MISTLRTLAVGAAAAALLVGMTASPASAKTRTFDDKRGDAVPGLDITKVKVANKKHAVVVTAKIPAFNKKKLGGVMLVLRTKNKGRPEFAAMKMRIDGAGWMPLLFLREDGDDFIAKCKGDRVTIAKRAIKIRIPQRCLDHNRRAVRAQVMVIGRGAMESEEFPSPGADSTMDGHPNLNGFKFTPWVRYR